MGERYSPQNPFEPPSEAAEYPVRGWQPSSHGQLLATYWQRFAGNFVDGLLYGLAALPALVIGLAVADPSEEAGFATLGFAALAVVCLAGFQWYLISTTGQSLAKRWLRMRIVREDGSLPGFVHGVLLRTWVLGALGCVPWVGNLVGLVDALLIFSGSTRQTLHDRIARTIVIQV